VFITLPNVFQQMPGGFFFSILFFLLLTVAALTSSISILEVVVAYFREELKIKRKLATILATAMIAIVGVFCSLSMGLMKENTLFGLNFFDLLDWISANMLLPLGGLFISLFIGWYWGREKIEEELAKGSKLSRGIISAFIFVLKFIAPGAIAIVFLHGLGIFQ